MRAPLLGLSKSIYYILHQNQHNYIAVGLLNLIFVFLFYLVQIAPTAGNGIALPVSLPISFIQWKRERGHQTKDELYNCSTLT